jgi:hypothetical protein
MFNTEYDVSDGDGLFLQRCCDCRFNFQFCTGVFENRVKETYCRLRVQYSMHSL